MPIRAKCFSCNALLAFPAGLAGGEVECPKCGAALVVPGEAPARVRDADVPPPLPLAIDEGPRESLRSLTSSAKREPWYYRFLAGYGWLCIVVGALQFAWCASAVYRAEGTPPEGRGAPLIWSGAGLLGCLLGAAVAFVLVDVGRTVRARR